MEDLYTRSCAPIEKDIGHDHLLHQKEDRMQAAFQWYNDTTMVVLFELIVKIRTTHKSLLWVLHWYTMKNTKHSM